MLLHKQLFSYVVYCRIHQAVNDNAAVVDAKLVKSDATHKQFVTKTATLVGWKTATVPQHVLNGKE